MKILVRKKGNVNILDLSGKMVIGEGDKLLAETVRGLLEGGERYFLLNMEKVPWLDSGGIGEVVASFKRVREREGVIKLVKLSSKAHDLFTMTALNKVFEIFGDEEDALGSFAG